MAANDYFLADKSDYTVVNKPCQEKNAKNSKLMCIHTHHYGV